MIMRQSIRLPNYDYSRAGFYFITICTENRSEIFGAIQEGTMVVNEIGHAVSVCWNEIPLHYHNIQLDYSVIMPNHIHGILFLTSELNMPNRTNSFQHIIPGSIGAIVRGFKIGVTKMCKNMGIQNPVWQRNFYDHIVRSEAELFQIRQYICNNPVLWDMDRLNGGSGNRIWD